MKINIKFLSDYYDTKIIKDSIIKIVNILNKNNIFINDIFYICVDISTYSTCFLYKHSFIFDIEYDNLNKFKDLLNNIINNDDIDFISIEKYTVIKNNDDFIYSYKLNIKNNINDNYNEINEKISNLRKIVILEE